MTPARTRLLNELKRLPISIHSSFPSADLHFKHMMNFADIPDKNKSCRAFDLVLLWNSFRCIDIDSEKDQLVVVMVGTPWLDLKSYSFTRNTTFIGRMTFQSFPELRNYVYFLAKKSMTCYLTSFIVRSLDEESCLAAVLWQLLLMCPGSLLKHRVTSGVTWTERGFGRILELYRMGKLLVRRVHDAWDSFSYTVPWHNKSINVWFPHDIDTGQVPFPLWIRDFSSAFGSMNKSIWICLCSWFIPIQFRFCWRQTFTIENKMIGRALLRFSSTVEIIMDSIRENRCRGIPLAPT